MSIQVERRHGLLRADSVSRNHTAGQRIRPLQQPARKRDIARFDQPTHLTRRNDAPAAFHRPHDSRFESVTLAQLCQHVRVARLLMTESKILADQHHFRAQCLHHDFSYKFFGRQPGRLQRERKNQHLLNSLLSHQRASFVRRGQQARRALRRHYAGRMRIERQHRRAQIPLPRQLHHLRKRCRCPACTPSKLPMVRTVFRIRFPVRLRFRGRRKRGAHSEGNAASVFSCGRSWQMCVKNARRGFSSSTHCRLRSTVECVGCGRWRNASRNNTSRPCSFAFDSSGMSL